MTRRVLKVSLIVILSIIAFGWLLPNMMSKADDLTCFVSVVLLIVMGAVIFVGLESIVKSELRKRGKIK